MYRIRQVNQVSNTSEVIEVYSKKENANAELTDIWLNYQCGLKDFYCVTPIISNCFGLSFCVSINRPNEKAQHYLFQVEPISSEFENIPELTSNFNKN